MITEKIFEVQCIDTHGTGYYSDGGMGKRKYLTYGTKYNVLIETDTNYLIQTKKSKERIGWINKNNFIK